MKLSEKGFEKILDTCHFVEGRATYALSTNPEKDYYFEIEETNFESNDFEDCVMLTVEEAKILLEITRHKKLLTEREVVEIVKLILQIEQAEKCDAQRNNERQKRDHFRARVHRD